MTWPTLPAWPTLAPTHLPVPAAPASRAETVGLVLLSASQADTFNDCERKWGFEKLDKLPKSVDPSARLGTAVHGDAEDYLKLGKSPDLQRVLELPKGRGAPGTNTFFPGQIFEPGIPYLPAPGTVWVEGKRTWTTPGAGDGPIHWQGTRDGLTVRLPDGTTTLPYYSDGSPIDLPHGARLEVWDHKTTSNFKYMRTLETDIQGNLYAWDTLQEFGVSEVDARWLYYLTRGRPQARLLSHTYQRSAVVDQIARIDSLGRRMLQLYRERPPAKDLEPNPKTCDKYGGCPYRYGNTCPLTISQRMSTMTTTPTNPQANFEAMLAAARNGLPAPGADLSGALGGPPPGMLPALPPAPAPAPQAAPAPSAFVTPPGQPWRPGDPMNPTQEWLLTQPNPKWSTLAHAANVPEHVAIAYDAMFEPPGRYGIVSPRGSVPIPTPTTPSAPPAPGAAVTQGINPPDAPAYAPANPESVPPRIAAPQAAPAAQQTAPQAAPPAGDPFAGLDRDALKALCVSKGLCSSGCRVRDIERFKQALLTGVAIPDPGEPPAQAPQPAPTPAVPQTLHTAEAPYTPQPVPAQPVPAQPVPAQPAPAPAPTAPAPAISVPNTGMREAGAGFALYVYCLPTKGQGHSRTLRVSEICGQIFPELQKRTGAPHYSMIDYGKGRGAFAGLLEEFLQVVKLGPETAVIVERTPEGADALTVLERYAGSIVRGL